LNYRAVLYASRHGLGLGKPQPLRLGSCSHEGTYMEDPTKEEILHRAYELWEQAGKPEGRDDEFYRQAEEELRNEGKSPPQPPPDIL